MLSVLSEITAMLLNYTVVHEVEQGQLSLNVAQRKYGIQGNATIKTWLLKYGSLDWENKSHLTLENPQNKSY